MSYINCAKAKTLKPFDSPPRPLIGTPEYDAQRDAIANAFSRRRLSVPPVTATVKPCNIRELSAVPIDQPLPDAANPIQQHRFDAAKVEEAKAAIHAGAYDNVETIDDVTADIVQRVIRDRDDLIDDDIQSKLDISDNAYARDAANEGHE